MSKVDKKSADAGNASLLNGFEGLRAGADPSDETFALASAAQQKAEYWNRQKQARLRDR